MQGKLLLVGILSLSIPLSSCISLGKNSYPSRDSRNQMCPQLKQQLIFDTSNLNSRANYTPIEQAELANQYDYYSCPDSEAPPAPPSE